MNCPRFLLGLLLVGLVGCDSVDLQYQPENRLSESQRHLLEHSDSLVLYSLEPLDRQYEEQSSDDEQNAERESAPGTFHDWPILGHATITDPALKSSLVESLDNGMTRVPGTPAACFWPRHGLRATRGEQTLDVVICFECHQMEVYAPDFKFHHVSRAPQKTFEAAVVRAGLPVPRPLQ